MSYNNRSTVLVERAVYCPDENVYMPEFEHVRLDKLMHNAPYPTKGIKRMHIQQKPCVTCCYEYEFNCTLPDCEHPIQCATAETCKCYRSIYADEPNFTTKEQEHIIKPIKRLHRKNNETFGTIAWIMQYLANEDQKLEVLTCFRCLDWKECPYAFDLYNTEGDCLGAK